jgi:hypothetical protein
MLRDISGAKAFTRFIARDKRADIIAIEDEIRRLGETVDGFYALLGDRNWIYTEDLSTTLVEGILSLPADEAERILIDSFKDEASLRLQVRRLGRFAGLLARMGLLDRALEDFIAERYYATVQVLLSVMDGFVNDLEPGRRRGLHARDSEELQAWDSVVGHHRGLTQAHATFTKTFKRRSDEPVTEVYRNGIVHGMLTNYDNDIVAAKAWNRLFAVADWATSLEMRDVPAKPQPSLRDSFRSLARSREARRALEAWQPSVLEAGDEGFEEDEAVIATKDYLEAWQRANFGAMARWLSPLVAQPTPGQTAGQVRAMFEDHTLTSYRLERVSHRAAAVALVDAVLDTAVRGAACRLRWIRAGSDGRGVSPNEEGTWGLVTWTFEDMLSAREQR